MTFPPTDGHSDNNQIELVGGAPSRAAIGRLASHAQKWAWVRARPRLFLLMGICSASVVAAQVSSIPVVDMYADPPETEEGIPVTDKLTIQKCGTCHAPDAKGNLSRISWSRATPEAWSQAIKRMVRLNGLQITPDESRSVVKYLAAQHGLAPEEAKSVFYLTEHRIADETTIPNDTVRTCASCHSMAYPLSWRRSKTEWKLLQNMHVAMFSQSESQFRRPTSPDGTAPLSQGAPLPTTPTPTVGQVAIDYIAKTAQLHSPEWAAWRPRIKDPRLAGRWAIAANVPGQGRFVGEMTIQPAGAPDEFTTTTTLRSLKTGATITRKGTGLVYAGYSWRGRSDGGAAKSGQPDDMQSMTREAMWFSPDQKTAEGRWFWGAYQEFGFDVKLTRTGAGPTVASVMPYALKAGATGTTVHILGDSLPAAVSPADIDFGAGVTVSKVVSATPGDLTVIVNVAPNAADGQRDVSVAGTVLEKALPVYHKVDYLKVTPETALARLGDGKHPKGYQQFDAIGYTKGADGKPNTADDVAVGPVDVDWTIQEFSAVFSDDDKDFVGMLSPTALFTPNIDGPNPQRRFGRNNYGDVWVVATAKTEKDPFGKPLTGRSYLVVTVPAYQRWDQPEVSQ